MDSHWAHANYWDEPTMVIFWRTSLGVFFLCVLAAAAHLPHFAESWPLRPVRYLGEVSYGIYPWHLFAIEVCLKIADITPVQALGTTLGLSVLLAATSWHLLEKPILDRARRFGGGILPQERAICALCNAQGRNATDRQGCPQQANGFHATRSRRRAFQ